MSRLHATLLLSLLMAAGAGRAQVVDDVLTQDVVVDTVGPDLHIEVTLLAATPDGADELWMFTPSLPITSLTVDGVDTTSSPHPSYPDLVTIVDLPASTASEREIRYVLQGEPDCFVGGYKVCERSSTGTVLVPTSADLAWHYVGLISDDAFLGSIEVRAPEDQHVLAGQGAVATVTSGGDGTARWRYELEVPTNAMWMFARDVSELTSANGGVHGFVEPGTDGAVMQGLIDLAEELRPVYEARFGALPVEELHVVAVETGYAFGAIGMLGNVLIGDFIFDDAFAYLQDQGIAHELAHTWWGGLTSAGVPAEGRALQEGMAEYSAWLGLGELWGDDVRTAGSRMNAVWYMYGRPPGIDVAPLDENADYSPASVHVAYHKSSTVYRSLEEAAGAETFQAALGDIVAAGAGALTMDGIVAAVAARGGGDVSPIVDQWMRRPGFPHLEVKGEWADGELCLRVSTQDDFHFDLPVRLHAVDGAVSDLTVAVDIGTTDVCVPASERPAAVELDPRWTLVRELRPYTPEDVTLDGRVDAADLIAVALAGGGAMPPARRVDGAYDPFFDVDFDLDVDARDLERVLDAAAN